MQIAYTPAAKKATEFTPRQREENEALPRTNSIWALPVLKSLSMGSTRPGSDAHKSIRSHGFPT